ncbi:MAG TPA: hypothetical protein VGQ57_18780 [Polyangiaceae bacterium]|nr:hypothetical protein [Polyangiaceae bacterium]
MKKLLLTLAALAILLVALVVYAMHADQQRLRAGTNPCENACLEDSGGIEDCRRECASHPLTYGPASLPPSR